MRLVFEIFKVFKGSPFYFFLVFAPEWILKKPEGPPFTFFGTMRLLKILIFRKLKKKSKLFNVSEVLHFFDILQQTGFSKSQRVPLATILKALRFLSLGYGADFRRSRLVERLHKF